jgi:hypothetical protein
MLALHMKNKREGDKNQPNFKNRKKFLLTYSEFTISWRSSSANFLSSNKLTFVKAVLIDVAADRFWNQIADGLAIPAALANQA